MTSEERRVSVRAIITVLAVFGITLAVLELLFFRAYAGTPTGDIPLLVEAGITVAFFLLLPFTRTKAKPT